MLCISWFKPATTITYNCASLRRFTSALHFGWPFVFTLALWIVHILLLQASLVLKLQQLKHPGAMKKKIGSSSTKQLKLWTSLLPRLQQAVRVTTVQGARPRHRRAPPIASCAPKKVDSRFCRAHHKISEGIKYQAERDEKLDEYNEVMFCKERCLQALDDKYAEDGDWSKY